MPVSVSHSRYKFGDPPANPGVRLLTLGRPAHPCVPARPPTSSSALPAWLLEACPVASGLSPQELLTDASSTRLLCGCWSSSHGALSSPPSVCRGGTSLACPGVSHHSLGFSPGVRHCVHTGGHRVSFARLGFQSPVVFGK